MIIVPVLTTSLIHFSLKCWGNVLVERGSERVKQVRPQPLLALRGMQKSNINIKSFFMLAITHAML